MLTHQLASLNRVVLIALFLSCSIPVLANDQQKAEKRLRQISAMADQPIARSIVNQTMAEDVGAKRIELYRQRQAMNLSYGSLFLAHRLEAAGAKMLDIALQLKSGKTLIQIANERNVDWKAVNDAAKKLNARIEENIYQHFLHTRASDPTLEKYKSEMDIVRADGEVSPEELIAAQASFEVWKNRGSAPNSGMLDTNTATALGKQSDDYHVHPY